MTYADKLRDPRWQKLRLEILQRDNFTCLACCLKENELHVHHLRYARGNPWESAHEDLVSLCKRCHKEAEEIKPRLAKLMVFRTEAVMAFVKAMDIPEFAVWADVFLDRIADKTFRDSIIGILSIIAQERTDGFIDGAKRAFEDPTPVKNYLATVCQRESFEKAS